MKNKLYIHLALAGLLLTACDEDFEKTYISADPVDPALESPASPDALLFTKDDAEEMIDFTWTASDFGFPASITYGVEISPSQNFAVKTTLLTSQNLTGSAKVGDINGILLAWKLPVGEPATINARVFASVSPAADSAISEVKTFNVAPYETLIDYPMIYVPGAYQGWSPGAENGRLYSYEFNEVYQGIIRLNGGDPVEFKIAPAANWDNSWGGSLTPSGNNYTGSLNPTGGNFSAAAGVYKFDVDTDALTISLTKTDDWGIIGSAVPPYDWSADVDLFYNGQRQMWEITGDFKAGEFKFRANDDWGLNLGDNNTDGSLEEGGTNIPIAEDGNYTIRVNVTDKVYTVLKN